MDPHRARERAESLYETLHAPLRASMAHAQRAIETAAPQDDAAVAAALQAIDTMLAAVEEHMRRERDVLHTALEARWPGRTAQATAGHSSLADLSEALRDEAAALRAGAVTAPRPADESRTGAVQRLRRHVAAFCDAKRSHMHFEETALGPVLVELYGEQVGELARQMALQMK